MESERWARVKELCLAALDREEDKRQRFLDEACGSDSALRQEVESLLLQEKDAGEFLESPPLDLCIQLLGESEPERFRAAADPDQLIGKNVSHYRILEKLGAGGMGNVYKAEDLDLGRLVALKFLSPAVFGSDQNNSLSDAAVARIEREARAASALDHPNICTVYEVNRYEEHRFIAMQFLPGKNLKQKINGEPLPWMRVVDLGIQIADALDAAHAAGITHRDITSSNIVLTQRGEAKIVDFGLAKLATPQTSPTDALRNLNPDDVGTSSRAPASDNKLEPSASSGWGTASYMSPEQVLGEPLDARSDLFSLGVVLYEMATGKLPFEGKTSKEVIDNILHRTPISPSVLVPGLNIGLTQIICKATQVDRNHRYQKASEIHQALLKIRDEAASNKLRRPGWRTASLAAVMTVALLLAAGYYLRRRSDGIGARDTLVLADFNNTTGDPVFDEALKQALRVQLEQSPFLNVLSDQKVGQQLRYMGLAGDARVTPALARDVCLRTASKVMLIGSISTLGKHYVLGLSALNCQNGDTLLSRQIETDSRETVLHSLDKISTVLRTQLGESLPTIRKYDVPVEQATTSSLDALRAYGLGIKTRLANGDKAAIPFFERASELDPNFAMAYARAATGYFNLGQPVKAGTAMRKAFALHDRVSERERLYIDSHYYMTVTGELDKAMAALELWQQGYPREQSTYIDLGVMHFAAGQYEEGLQQDLQALKLDPGSATVYASLAAAYRKLGRLQESEDTLHRAQQLKLGGSMLLPSFYDLAFLRGDTEEMQRQVKAAAGQPRFEALLLALQADSEAYYGYLTNANDSTQRAIESALRHGEPDAASGFAEVRAWRDAEFGERHAREELDASLHIRPAQEQSELDAFILARTGHSDQAITIARQLQENRPVDTILNNYWLPTIGAAVELNRRHFDKAIELLETAEPYEMGLQQVPTTGALFPIYLRGLAFLGAGDGKNAAVEFQKILDHRSIVGSCSLGALAHLDLARAFAINRETIKARAAYQDFFTLWKNADPQIPILKEAEAEYARLQ
jgi:serine/threonine protein kinase/Tfp pilus assembly protein PilF